MCRSTTQRLSMALPTNRRDTAPEPWWLPASSRSASEWRSGLPSTTVVAAGDGDLVVGAATGTAAPLFIATTFTSHAATRSTATTATPIIRITATAITGTRTTTVATTALRGTAAIAIAATR